MKQLIADVRRYWDRRAIVAVRSLCRFGHVLKTAAGDSLVAVLGQALRRTDYRLVEPVSKENHRSIDTQLC